MDFVQRRENDVQYLKTVIAQRQIAIQQCERQKSNVQKQVKSLSIKVQSLQADLVSERAKYIKQTTNLNMALKEMQHQNQQLRHEKHQLQFQLNVAKMRSQQQGKQHTKQIYKLKNQFQSQKQTFMQKIGKLEKNLTTLNNHYHVQDEISEDKHKIIQDANRNLRGFANQKQQRMIIIQNQQLTNQIQFQSRQISSLLEKSQKLQQEIKQYKMDLQLHKNIENDLVKRSSLAQNLIKQLNSRIKQLQMKLQSRQRQIQSSNSVRQSKVSDRKSFQSDQRSGISDQNQGENKKQLSQIIAKLKFQNATLKNYNHFLQTSQKNNNKKFQNLGQIMAQHLQLLLIKNKNYQQVIQGSNNLTIDINTLKSKQIKEWRPQQTQVVLNLLFTQIRPYISKSSLISFPEAKNIKVSFIQQPNKQPLSLPKIIEDYQKAQKAQMSKKGGSRFKDIPVDISTKILRSNLREWGTKVTYGTNIGKNRKQISKSIMVQGQKQII